MANSKRYSFSFLSFKEITIISIGLLMIILYSSTDMFNNVISSYVYNFTQGIFVICAFVLIFFRLANKTGVKFKLVKEPEEGKVIESSDKDSVPKEEETKEKEETQTPMHINMSMIDKLFYPIQIITYILLITNFLSCGYYFYDTMYYQKQHVKISQSDVSNISILLSSMANTQKAIVDSVNSKFPKQIFFVPGKVVSMRLDTGSNFCYYYVIKNRQRQFNLTVSSLKIRITNFTGCNEKEFCSCDSANICLKDKHIELYYLLYPRHTKKEVKTDTLYFSRILLR